MISKSKENDSPRKQEGSKKNNGKLTNPPKAPSSASASSWLRLKDPRIVRVSRAFGGKDRHSKVSTIRGLRDRRVRLSVPTAIQLYDLQDRLGLNQPSKVIDWLLNIAKDEIDELPPLPISPLNFALNHHQQSTNFFGSDALWSDRTKDDVIKDDHKERQESDHAHAEVSGNNLISSRGFLNNMPYGFNNYHMEPSNFPLSQFGVASSHQIEEGNAAQFPSDLSLSFGGTTQPLFPNSHVDDNDHIHGSRQIDINNFHQVSSQNLFSSAHPFYSISQPFQLRMTPRLLDSHNSNHKDFLQDFPSK